MRSDVAFFFVVASLLGFCSVASGKGQIVDAYMDLKARLKKDSAIVGSLTENMFFSSFCHQTGEACRIVYEVYDKVKLNFGSYADEHGRICVVYFRASPPMKYLKFQIEELGLVKVQDAKPEVVGLAYFNNDEKKCSKTTLTCENVDDKELNWLWSTGPFLGQPSLPTNPLQTPLTLKSDNAVHRLTWRMANNGKLERNLNLKIMAWNNETLDDYDIPTLINEKRKKVIPGTLQCDGDGTDFDFASCGGDGGASSVSRGGGGGGPDVMIHISGGNVNRANQWFNDDEDGELFTDYDVPEKPLDQGSRPVSKLANDESDCITWRKYLSRSSNLDHLLIMVIFVFYALLGLYWILAMTYYMLVFDKQRDMVLEEEYEYTVYLGEEREGLSEALCRYLSENVETDRKAALMHLTQQNATKNGGEDDVKVATTISRLPKIVPLEEQQKNDSQKRSTAVSALPALKGSSVVRPLSLTPEDTNRSTGRSKSKRRPRNDDADGSVTWKPGKGVEDTDPSTVSWRRGNTGNNKPVELDEITSIGSMERESATP